MHFLLHQAGKYNSMVSSDETYMYVCIYECMYVCTNLIRDATVAYFFLGSPSISSLVTSSAITDIAIDVVVNVFVPVGGSFVTASVSSWIIATGCGPIRGGRCAGVTIFCHRTGCGSKRSRRRWGQIKILQDGRLRVVFVLRGCERIGGVVTGFAFF